MNGKAFLSKSKYLNGLQCPKLLWYAYNRKRDIPPPDPAVQFSFDEGRRVGELARSLFPGGILVERSWSPPEQAARSLAALRQRKPLFEAGFVFGRAYALADILVPVGEDGWELIEVKSSTSIKEEHFHDLAFQLFVYRGAGLKIERCWLMHLNKEYVRRGELDPRQLLVRKEATIESEVLAGKVPGALQALLQEIARPEAPAVKVGSHCYSPHECPLTGLCWSFLPDADSVFILYSGGRKSWELFEAGIERIADIPDRVELNYRQVIQREAHQSGRPYVNQKELRRFLDTLRYPLSYLDFETIAPAIPLFDGTGPYHQLPFQFSLYRQESPEAELAHHVFLAEGRGDPRPELLRRLNRLLGDAGSIVAYSAGFERNCLKSAARAYPEYAEWHQRTARRFVDLLEPFQKFHYYHPAQQGKASLKNVLPALTGLSYQGMTIGEGGAAQAEFCRVNYGEAVDPAEQERVREALVKYCDQDTYGMAKIIEVLRQAVV